MAFKVFLIPARHNERELEELNEFLKTHIILSTRWEWCASGEYWTVLVDYKTSTEALALKYEARSTKPDVDYQEVLSAQEFQVFGKIKDWRHKESRKLKIPAFTLFTNAQLATMIQNRVANQEALAAVVGDERAKSYSEVLLKYLKALPPKEDVAVDKDKEEPKEKEPKGDKS